MIALPAATPVTIPLLRLMVIAALELIHVPPEGVLLNVVTAPSHTVSVPLIGEGTGSTVNIVVLIQPVVPSV
jgi:hypothetical protein